MHESHIENQINNTALWTNSPTKNDLTYFAEKKANELCITSLSYTWLHAGVNTWCAIQKRYFQDHKVIEHPMCVNLHIVTLDEHGYMRCTCNKSRRWRMPCHMITCTRPTIAGIMFHVS